MAKISRLYQKITVILGLGFKSIEIKAFFTGKLDKRTDRECGEPSLLSLQLSID